MAIFVAIGGFLFCGILCEATLRKRRLQSNLPIVLLIYTLGAGILFTWLRFRYLIGFAPFFLLWTGMFGTWFAVRSHIESSILMRMLYALRQRPMTAEELIAEYEAHYNDDQRIEELVRGGFLARSNKSAVLAPKGRFLIEVISRFR